MIEVIANDRLGRKGTSFFSPNHLTLTATARTDTLSTLYLSLSSSFLCDCPMTDYDNPRSVRVKCLPTDTIGDLKKLIAAQTGTIASKIQLKKWYVSSLFYMFLRVRARWKGCGG